MRTFTIILLCLLITPVSAFAKDASRLATFRGVLGVSNVDSSIDDPDSGDGVVFVTNSKVGKAIFAVCKAYDLCEVTGVVVGEYPELISVKKVLRIKAGQ